MKLMKGPNDHPYLQGLLFTISQIRKKLHAFSGNRSIYHNFIEKVKKIRNNDQI